MKALSPKQLLRASFASLFFLLLGFMACLQHFALTLPQKSPLADILTDGLVVATGGQLRINEGLRLIEQGASSRMLITGVGKGISKASLTETFAKTNAQQSIFNCCVDLDATAIDTRGNALAARNWVQTHQLTSISLVTANYHMPRALLYFQRIMPDVAITSLPVSPPDLQPKKWYANWPTAKLLMREYAKYLVVLIFS
jgi:uncharacterized SAM-binding protein YcdF (DUF218 family)